MIVFRSASEARTALYPEFTLLQTTKWAIKSPQDTGYQCIAWAACRTDRKWWPWDHPMFYWPPGFQKHPVFTPVPVVDFMDMFQGRFGYQACNDSSFELGYQKIAIYADALGVTHMARQRLFGSGWLSKLGDNEDIVHEKAEHVHCVTYGTAAQYMKRSWWTAARTFCLFRCIWETLKFTLYRVVVRWDLT